MRPRRWLSAIFLGAGVVWLTASYYVGLSARSPANEGQNGGDGSGIESILRTHEYNP